jgi:hypothetical protein
MKLLGLPNEVWIRILGKSHQKDLLNASLVSKKLRELALDPALWTRLDLRDRGGLDLDIYKGRDSLISTSFSIIID